MKFCIHLLSISVKRSEQTLTLTVFDVCEFHQLLVRTILKRKRSTNLSKTVVSSFSSKNSASDNVIAKYRYLPCIHHQYQTAVTYGWRAATRNVRQPPFLKSQSSKIVPILRKKRFKPISVFESKRVDKIKSGTFMFLSTSILSK